MTRKPFVVANWKMNHARSLAHSWCTTLAELHRTHPWPAQVETGVAPPFTSIETVHAALAGLPVAVGAQNMHWEAKGAFTGELTAEMLRDAGCSFVILGHSERRQLFGETDDRVARKVAAAHAAGLLPLLCVGETESDREAGLTEALIELQLRRALGSFVPKNGAGLVIAYEPVWAIGTGKVATPQQAEEAHAFLRGILGVVAGTSVAEATRILYGGSVTPANAAELWAQPNIDGFLIGGASLDAASYHKIVMATA